MLKIEVMGRTKKIKNNIPAEIPTTVPVLNTKKNIDRIASVEQKESAMAEAGVTRLKTYKVINDLLTAVKIVETLQDGQVIKTEVPDVTANSKGAELALKAFNDLKEFQASVGSIHNKVVYQWLNVNTSAGNPVPPTRISDVE